MQFAIEIPETMGFELKTLGNANEFIIQAIQKSLAENKRKKEFKLALAMIQQQASDNGLTEIELEKLLHD
jgi:hypothetical protein